MSARAALSPRSSPSLLVALFLPLLSFPAFAQLSNKRLSLPNKGHYRIPSLFSKRSNQALRPGPSPLSPCRINTISKHQSPPTISVRRGFGSGGVLLGSPRRQPRVPSTSECRFNKSPHHQKNYDEHYCMPLPSLICCHALSRRPPWSLGPPLSSTGGPLAFLEQEAESRVCFLLPRLAALSRRPPWLLVKASSFVVYVPPFTPLYR